MSSTFLTMTVDPAVPNLSASVERTSLDTLVARKESIPGASFKEGRFDCLIGEN